MPSNFNPLPLDTWLAQATIQTFQGITLNWKKNNLRTVFSDLKCKAVTVWQLREGLTTPCFEDCLRSFSRSFFCLSRLSTRSLRSALSISTHSSSARVVASSRDFCCIWSSNSANLKTSSMSTSSKTLHYFHSEMFITASTTVKNLIGKTPAFSSI